MRREHPPFHDGDAVRRQTLEAGVVNPRRDRALDALCEQILEDREKLVLQMIVKRDTRFRKVVIGGNSSRSTPPSAVRLSPVASSKRCRLQASTLPAWMRP